MILLKNAIEAAVSGFIEQHTGVSAVLKPSKKAHLATNAFLRTNADTAAKTLSAHAKECVLFSVPLIDDVRAENGWLLFFFTADVIDAYADALPPAEEPDDSYLSRRLWIAARHPDAPVPRNAFVLDGFYAVLFSAPNAGQRWLSAPRHADGNERVALEQRLSRAAKVLLWERRNTP